MMRKGRSPEFGLRVAILFVALVMAVSLKAQDLELATETSNGLLYQ
jgi:hypothetical protein